jgi:hypothetical protein
VSDSITIYVPIDPFFVPPESMWEAARALVSERLAMADQVTVETSEHPDYVCTAENWDGVQCHSCDADHDVWWWTALEEKGSEEGFGLLDVITLCCHLHTFHSDLPFGWPEALACFAVHPCNANVGEPPVALLEGCVSLVGAPVRVIHRHI